MELPRYCLELLRVIRDLNVDGIRRCRSDRLAEISKKTNGKTYSPDTIKVARAQLRREGFIEVEEVGPRLANLRVTDRGLQAVRNWEASDGGP